MGEETKTYRYLIMPTVGVNQKRDQRVLVIPGDLWPL